MLLVKSVDLECNGFRVASARLFFHPEVIVRCNDFGSSLLVDELTIAVGVTGYKLSMATLVSSEMCVDKLVSE